MHCEFCCIVNMSDYSTFLKNARYHGSVVPSVVLINLNIACVSMV